MEIVKVSKKEMAEVDGLAVEKFDLCVKQMMENAGRNVARWIQDRLKPCRVICVYGKGNNGGDALCCARHLKIYGRDVSIICASSDVNDEVKNQLKILKEMEVEPIDEIGEIVKGDVVIDGLIGYNISGDPRERFAELIEEINKAKEEGATVVSYDLPSGMEPDSGKCFSPCVRADYTMTLALPKKGVGGESVGELYLVNIGVPWELYGDLGIEVGNYFSEGDVVLVN